MRKRRRSSTRSRVFLLVVFVIAAIVGSYYFLELNRPGHSYPYWEKEQGTIRFATVNVNGFRSLNSADLTGEFVLNALTANEVDVVVMQEYRSVWRFVESDFRQTFSSYFPYILVDGEQAILSRLPIEESKMYGFDFSPDSYASYVVRDAEFNLTVQQHYQV